MKILIVDDDVGVISSTERALRQLGYEVAYVYNGRDAVDFYRDHMNEIGLVILDMTMPGMGGVECFRMLNVINPGVRMLLVSGYALNNIQQGFVPEERFEFIQKPYGMSRLEEAVNRVLTQ